MTRLVDGSVELIIIVDDSVTGRTVVLLITVVVLVVLVFEVFVVDLVVDFLVVVLLDTTCTGFLPDLIKFPQ